MPSDNHFEGCDGMHTFFINTSNESFEDKYEVLFDIHYENRTLVSLDYPLSDWYDPEKGYMDCLKKMSDMIDGYVELNNAFNLIIYIDLSGNEEYSSIVRDAFHDRERQECLSAMQILFTHAINQSIVEELVDAGRKPQDVLIMFGADKKFSNFGANEVRAKDDEIRKRVFKFIGLPDDEAIREIAKGVVAGSAEDKVADFKEQILSKCTEELIPGILKSYITKLDLWCEKIITEQDDIDANNALFASIEEINSVESDRLGIKATVCPYDCNATKGSKSALALKQLNVALHVLRCAENRSIFKDDVQRELMEFNSYSVEDMAYLFQSKEIIFSEKVEKLDGLNDLYRVLNLIPRRYVFDHSKFGLDEYGDSGHNLIIRSVKPTENNTDEVDSETIILPDKTFEVVEEREKKYSLFSDKEYKPFSYEIQDDGTPAKSPEEYIRNALKERKHHLDYMKKLRVHISQVLSNYAGKSKENIEALLQMGKFRYSKGREETAETKTIEVAKTVAENAYETMLQQYLDFCSGGVVALTDIKEQCDWFVTRIRQIQNSLNKIRLVGVGSLIGLVVLYLPFVIIQFEAIISNLLTLSVALGSIAVPLAVLGAVFGAVAAKQRKKYAEAWYEFKKKSEDALNENKIAVKNFDTLLAVAIPALRWVYEYKLDVAFCLESCDIADAKIEHHRQILHKRVEALQNILRDLQFEVDEASIKKKFKFDIKDIDFNSAFCSGDKNIKFYSIVDKSFFKEKNILEEA